MVESRLALRVAGMTCGGCESKLRHALAQVPGIARVAVDRGEKRVEVSGSAPADAVIRAIEQAGFASVERAA